MTEHVRVQVDSEEVEVRVTALCPDTPHALYTARGTDPQGNEIVRQSQSKQMAIANCATACR